jgi:hypothetical protein
MFHQHLLLDHGSDEGDVQETQPHPRDTVSTLLYGYLYHKNAFRSALIRCHHRRMAVDEFCWCLFGRGENAGKWYREKPRFKVARECALVIGGCSEILVRLDHKTRRFNHEAESKPYIHTAPLGLASL